jgi:Spy/CpxP family protein refolding chaperone
MLRCSFLSGLVMAILTTLTYAQPPGGGGFGGPGGMGSAGLLAMPAVQTELKITDAQKQPLEDFRSELQKDIQEAMSGFDFQGLQDLSQEERAKKMAEIRTKAEEITTKGDEKLAKILDESQMKRLKELRIQRAGAAAFAMPAVVAKLNLTDEQKAKITKIQEDARTQGRPQFNPDATQEERQAAFAKMQEARAKVLKDILATLDSDQTKTWTELTGKEFKFPQGRGRGGPPPASN